MFLCSWSRIQVFQMKTKSHKSWQQQCHVSQHPSFHPSAAACWPHTVPSLAVLCSLISQSLRGHVVSRSHHTRALCWAQLGARGAVAAGALVTAVTCLMAPTSSSCSSSSCGKQGMHPSLIPGPSGGCRSFTESAMSLSIKNHKLQAVLIPFTKVTMGAPAVHVQRIFLNVPISQRSIPACLTPLRYNQREEAWASGHLSQLLH